MKALVALFFLTAMNFPWMAQEEVDPTQYLNSLLSSSNANDVERAYIYLLVRDFTNAALYVERALQANPQDELALLYQADIDFWQGRLQQAQKAYQNISQHSKNELYQQAAAKKFAQVQTKINYRAELNQTTRLSMFLGWFTLAVLLIAPGLVVLLFRGY